MKLKFFLVILIVMAVLFSSVADGSFGLKLEYCYNEELGEEVICGTYPEIELEEIFTKIKKQCGAV